MAFVFSSRVYTNYVYFNDIEHPNVKKLLNGHMCREQDYEIIKKVIKKYNIPGGYIDCNLYGISLYTIIDNEKKEFVCDASTKFLWVKKIEVDVTQHYCCKSPQSSRYSDIIKTGKAKTPGLFMT